MKLKTKPSVKLDKTIKRTLIDIGARVSYLTDNEMKKLKIKSIKNDIGIRDLLDTALQEILNNKSYEFKNYTRGATKRSFVISIIRLKEMRMFLVDKQDITQDLLIYNACLDVIQK